MKANALLGALAGAMVMTGCAATPPPPPPPPVVVRPGLPRPGPSATPPRGTDWRDLTIMAGDWRWSREGALSVARFALPNGTERLSFTCDPASRSVTLRHMGLGQREETVTITTTSTRRTVTGRGTAQPPYATEIAFAVRDPLLDAIAFSRGRFMVQLGSGDAIAPTWPEIARVIEDCR